MKVWGKTKIQRVEIAGVARAALEGSEPAILVRQAANVILAAGEVDRVGVWVDRPGESKWPMGGSFRGLVIDRGATVSPAEWSQLAVQPPVPQDVLLGLRATQQEFGNGGPKPQIGALLDMRRVLWVPVESRRRLRGVVLVGQRNKATPLPLATAQSVAAELALALELFDERRASMAGRVNANMVRRVLEALNSNRAADEILQGIVDECVGDERGIRAMFATIGLVRRTDVGPRGDIRGSKSDSKEAMSNASDAEVQFMWRSGESASTRDLQSGAVYAIWQKALKSRAVAGGEPGLIGSRDDPARVLAFPLSAETEMLGVLVVGIREADTSLAALDLVELRATLATEVLLREKSRRESRQRQLREDALFEGSRVAAVMLDINSTIVNLSSKAGMLLEDALLADEKQQAQGIDFAEFFAADSALRIRALLREAAQGREQAEVSRNLELRDGTQVRILLLPASREPHRTLLLQRVEGKEMEATRTELRKAFEWLEEGVVLFGANEEIRAMNSRFAQLTDIAPDELRKIRDLRQLSAALGPRTSDAAAFVDRWQQSVQGRGGVIRDEFHLVTPVERWLERAAHPIFDEGRTLLGRVEIYRDLTAQRLIQSKLLQAEKMAQLGQMLTGVAHELSNPLTSILGYAQRMAMREGTSGKSVEARQIFQQAERASAIVRQVLLSARDAPPERRPVSINQLILRTVELQNHSLDKKIRLELDLEPDLPLVHGDGGQLEQVLTNLMGNSHQALGGVASGAKIQVRTKRTADKRVLLEVADNGPGIPEAIQRRIFDPFFTTKPAGVGTGLGLSIVTGIVREHGGEVRVRSLPGQGSVFSVELPAVTTIETSSLAARADDGRAELETVDKQPVLPAASLQRWAGTRVLVLEDEPTVAQLIADVLHDEGIGAEILLDSRQALSRAADDYALVICDMKMPEVDGEQLYRALVRQGSPLSGRMLFVTGDVLSARTRNFLNRHGLPHVAKPFRVEELLEKIRSVLEASVFGAARDSAAARKNAATQ